MTHLFIPSLNFPHSVQEESVISCLLQRFPLGVKIVMLMEAFLKTYELRRKTDAYMGHLKKEE